MVDLAMSNIGGVGKLLELIYSFDGTARRVILS